MRSLVWIGVIYEVMTLFTVIANPYQANAIEWVHAGLLTVGALVVGWSIGREGHARLALTLILVACTCSASRRSCRALTQYADGDFSGVFPRWPYDMHKNAAGCLFGLAAAMAYARPTWVRWHPLLPQVCFWICVGRHRRDPVPAGDGRPRGRPDRDRDADPRTPAGAPVQGHPARRRRRARLRSGDGPQPGRVGQRVQLLLPARRLVRRVDPDLEDRSALRRRPALVVHGPVRHQVPATQRDPGDAEHRRPVRPGWGSWS